MAIFLNIYPHLITTPAGVDVDKNKHVLAIVKQAPVARRPLGQHLADSVNLMKRFSLNCVLKSKLPLQEPKREEKPRERVKERSEMDRCVSESRTGFEFSGPRGEGCNIVSRDN